jgi:DNA polymerase
MIIAAPDHRLMFADYSAIEARVLAWMAGQKDLVETFAKGGDVYIKMASAIYNVPEDKVTSEQRQVGKMAILGCGYGMGGKRFAEQCAAMGIGVDVEEAKRIVSIYRQENNQIAAYWQSLEAEYLELAREALDQGETILRYALPSGRSLTYRNPRIVQRETPWGTSQDTVEIDTLNSITRQWVPQKIWGGLAVENVVQATARDLMAGAMMRLENAGYPVIMSVHDEIICEVPEGYGSLDEMIEIMTSPPAWAKGCPIAAEGKEGPRYRK